MSLDRMPAFEGNMLEEDAQQAAPAARGRVLNPDARLEKLLAEHAAAKEEAAAADNLRILEIKISKAQSLDDLAEAFAEEKPLPKELLEKIPKLKRNFLTTRLSIGNFKREIRYMAEKAVDEGHSGSALDGQIRSLAEIYLPNLAGLQTKAISLALQEYAVKDNPNERYAERFDKHEFETSFAAKVAACRTIGELIPLAQKAYQIWKKKLPSEPLPEKLRKEALEKKFRAVVDAVRGFALNPSDSAHEKQFFEMEVDKQLGQDSFPLYGDVRSKVRGLVIAELNKERATPPPQAPKPKRRFSFE